MAEGQAGSLRTKLDIAEIIIVAFSLTDFRVSDGSRLPVILLVHVSVKSRSGTLAGKPA